MSDEYGTELPILETAQAAALALFPVYEPIVQRPRCANSTKEHKCENTPMQGHIFCTSCYLAYGGYLR